MKTLKIFQILFLTLFGMLGSLLVGLLFYNTIIFTPHLATFQFVMNGFIGALFFSLLKYKTKREQIFGIAIILLLDFVLVLGNSISLALVIRDVLFLGSLLLSIKLYYQFIEQNVKQKYYLRSFALVFIYSLLTIVFGTLVYLINAEFVFPPINFLESIGKKACLIGFGIGIGIDVYLDNEKRIMELLKIKT